MSTAAFLSEHGYLMLAMVVLADQTGLPTPAAPVLIAAGALVQAGTLRPLPLFAAAVVASMLGHSAWYYAGRHRGVAVLRGVCRLSLEPEACMRRTQDIFSRMGPFSLVAVRFIPGLDTMAQPLAGLSGMPPLRYLSLNLVGALLWAGSFLGLGYFFGLAVLHDLVVRALHLGVLVVPYIAALLAAYLGYKLVQRWRVLLDVKMERITVDELKARMDGGVAPVVVDLRTGLEARLSPRTIPGAVRLGRKGLDAHLAKVDREREIVLFCNCPHEIYAARMALSLARQGRTKVRPLEGGLHAWTGRRYPTVPVSLE
ncbi:MAG: sulfurtransferase [Deltaproteobacteria bacterium]|nr:MAG: sulfurtransferase [Deltaproteobacteria bacterium]